ncbi:MAG: hypothetical protein OEU26_20770 [Candidatus Tectomicrobia bacterium]|nr:hypothetical protein [Candidatus Tectomicrobia bacterium]
MQNQNDRIIMEEVTDSNLLHDAHLRRERFDRNYEWFQAHVAEIYAQHRGKCICVAGETLFVADTPHAAMDQARAAHPDDSGWFVHYIPKDKVARIYAH